MWLLRQRVPHQAQHRIRRGRRTQQRLTTSPNLSPSAQNVSLRVSHKVMILRSATERQKVNSRKADEVFFRRTVARINAAVFQPKRRRPSPSLGRVEQDAIYLGAVRLRWCGIGRSPWTKGIGGGSVPTKIREPRN